MLRNTIRYHLFWLFDRLKGGPIKTNLEEVHFILENPVSPEALKIRSKHLKKILKHVTETTNYYKNYKSEIDITQFPVVNKSIIKADYENFKSKLFLNRPTYEVSTSGSTGVPFTIIQSTIKKQRNTADVIYFFKACDYNVGDRLFHLYNWGNYDRKSAIGYWLKNVTPVDNSKFNENTIKKFIALLEKHKSENKAILGHSSSLERMCKYVEKEGISYSDLNLKSVVANSEYLNPYTKTTFGKHFNTSVVSRYSNHEVGLMAHQTLKSPDRFKLNHASYHIEVLDFDSDEPVKSGEYGRIVVTDLFNFAMPLIRYDTGDIAKPIQLQNDDVEFELVEGRKMDAVYDTRGNIIASLSLYGKFRHYSHILEQYQFIQHTKTDYEVVLNIKSGDQFNHEAELIASIKDDFGEDANINISYVDEIPPLSSGKRRQVVSHYQKN